MGVEKEAAVIVTALQGTDTTEGTPTEDGIEKMTGTHPRYTHIIVEGIISDDTPSTILRTATNALTQSHTRPHHMYSRTYNNMVTSTKHTYTSHQTNTTNRMLKHSYQPHTDIRTKWMYRMTPDNSN
jgi:hypothetical protein